jgi:NADH-quinone oxidoreductase subunit M
MQTLLLIAFPLVASSVVFLLENRSAKITALIIALIELAFSIWMLTSFSNSDLFQFEINIPWISSLGINLHLAVDGISMILVLLTTVLTPFIILSASSSLYKKASTFYGLILIMQSALIGVFTAHDGFLFYIFWEMALIPIYFICLLWGDENRSRITFKFFIYTLAGSLLMLVALVYLYYQTPGTHTFDLNAIYVAGRGLPATTQGLIFWGLFLAFAIKVPVFPFHTWQPDTYTVAPAPGTMLLSGIMLKMGVYGIIRWLLPVVPLGTKEWGMTALILSVVGIVYASCIAIMQKDYKRLIAYSSIAHVGLIVAGVLTMKQIGWQGAMIQMVSHGIVAVGLFYCIDIINTRTKTRALNDLGGIRSIAPVFTSVLIILVLGSVALPFTSGFVGEFLLLNSLYQHKWWLGAFAGLTIILGAVYMLRSFQAVILGVSNEKTERFLDLTLQEKVILFPLVALVICIGVYPTPLLQITEASVTKLIHSFADPSVTTLIP